MCGLVRVGGLYVGTVYRVGYVYVVHTCFCRACIHVYTNTNMRLRVCGVRACMCLCGVLS